MELAERQEMFSIIRALGATKAVCHYTGGGDSGGVESIEFYNGDTKVGNLSNGTQQDRLLWERFAAPLYDKYTHFNNEPYVDGTLNYDAIEGTIVLDGTESFTECESAYEEF